MYTNEGRVLGKTVKLALTNIARNNRNQAFHITNRSEKDVFIETQSQLYPVDSQVMHISSLEKPKLITFDEMELNPGFLVIPEILKSKSDTVDIETKIDLRKINFRLMNL